MKPRFVHSVRFVTILVFAASAFAQAPTAVEVTAKDFTKSARIRSTNLLTFGIKLGDNRADALSAAQRANLSARASRVGTELFDSNGRELALIDFTSERVSVVVWYADMAPYLAGEAQQLFDRSIADADSSIRLRLLGREDQRTGRRGSFGTTWTCSYDKEGIRVIKAGDAGPVIQLVEPARPRS